MQGNHIEQLEKIAREVALLTLEISYRAKVGHIGSALSIADILTVLYFSKLNISVDTLTDPSRDRFILSKGHAVAALYAVLHKRGILSREQLFSFGSEGGGLCEHPLYSDPAIEMTSGSLGYGIGFGVGIAYAMIKQRKESHVFVLISDGECGEGSIWEAAILAARLCLHNLTIILDYNRWQCFGRTEEVTRLEPLADKWKSFGWGVNEIAGHSIEQIKNALNNLPFEREKPSIIIAHTESGHGITSIQDKQDGHYKVFNDEEYQQARDELTKKM